MGHACGVGANGIELAADRGLFYRALADDHGLFYHGLCYHGLFYHGLFYHELCYRASQANGVIMPYMETVDEVKVLRGAVKLRPLKGSQSFLGGRYLRIWRGERRGV